MLSATLNGRCGYRQNAFPSNRTHKTWLKLDLTETFAYIVQYQQHFYVSFWQCLKTRKGSDIKGAFCVFYEALFSHESLRAARAVDHVAISKAIVSEMIEDNSGIEKAETVDCLGNNGCPDPCSQQKDKQHEKQHGEKQQENQPAKKRKKRKTKSKQEKTTRNDTDIAQTAKETTHWSTPDRVEPSTSSTTDHSINNNNNNRKVDTEKNGNELKTARNKDATIQTGRNDCWNKNTVLIVGDSMLNNIDERTLSKRYTTKVRCFRGSTVNDLHDYIKPLIRKKPDKIILVIGTNDIQNESVADVLKGIKS